MLLRGDSCLPFPGLVGAPAPLAQDRFSGEFSHPVQARDPEQLCIPFSDWTSQWGNGNATGAFYRKDGRTNLKALVFQTSSWPFGSATPSFPIPAQPTRHPGQGRAAGQTEARSPRGGARTLPSSGARLASCGRRPFSFRCRPLPPRKRSGPASPLLPLPPSSSFSSFPLRAAAAAGQKGGDRGSEGRGAGEGRGGAARGSPAAGCQPGARGSPGPRQSLRSALAAVSAPGRVPL